MKRLLLSLVLLIIFALSAFAGHTVSGTGQVIDCDCSTKEYVCYDDATNEPLPACAAAQGRSGHRAR